MSSDSRLFAISDLHLDHAKNWQALLQLPRYENDWLILGGDICETLEQMQRTLELLTERFLRLVWVPGNHELWVRPGMEFNDSIEKYEAFVALCQSYGVTTPEDSFPIWQGNDGLQRIVPLHLLYDYSFRPQEVRLDEAVSWAMDSGILCADEKLIKPGNYGSISAWCETRVEQSFQRLADIEDDLPLILVNHFPLRYDLVRIKRIPRFSIWCGTKQTEDWHTQFGANVVISGHLHVRATDYRDRVRFEEVSLGYPRDWRQVAGMHHYLRQILPEPNTGSHTGGTIHWY